jgi:aryl-alcohol dehydrogenase-like predicted oxidoreductase
MQSGILTETFTKARLKELPGEDWRTRSPRFQSPHIEKSLALRDALRPIAQRHGTTVSAIAVAWTLAWPGVTGAIVGARNPKQVDGWIDAATLALTNEDLDEISAAIDKTGAGQGPKRPASNRPESQTTAEPVEAR